MRTLATYIEYLLITRHYCYVPGHGAYMLAEESAALSLALGVTGKQSTIAAPRRVVRFSPLHHHDDGLLANLLMEAEGMTYDEACRYIARQVPLLTESFQQEAALHTNIDYFGLEDIQVDTWAAIERKKALAAAGDMQPAGVTPSAEMTIHAEKKEDTIAIPKYWIRRAAAIALIIVCFFANFLGLNDRVAEEQLAAVLDINMLQRAAQISPDWTSEDEESIDDAFAASIESIEQLEAEDDLALADEEAMEEETAQEEPAKQHTTQTETPDPRKWNESLPIRSMDSQLAMSQSPTGRLYYIIVASCATEADANRALGNLRHAGYDNVGVLERDGRFRLYVNFFAQKGEAESYLTKVRGIERFHDAWLLPVRDGSLSHIIKNTYNDNQLSMELSHLNQRTERDQG